MNVWWGALAVASGGALGALARWLVATTLSSLPAGRWSGFPVGTVVVNVVGTLILAWLVARGVGAAGAPTFRLFLATGFLAAFTTFSTFALDAQGLLQQGRAGQALLYVGGTLTATGVALLLGWWWGR